MRDNRMDDDDLYYDSAILGSSRVFPYDEWDRLYSPVRHSIADRA